MENNIVSLRSMEYVKWFHSKFIDRYDGCVKTLQKDHEVLINLIEQYSIKTIFEVGTWEGMSSLLMWLHPQVERVKTIDICKDYGHPYHKPKDTYGFYIKGTKISSEIISSFDYSPSNGEQYDMVFIDGCHNEDAVANDYQLALKLKPRLIVFHDYEDIDNSTCGVNSFIRKIKNEVNVQVYPNSIVAYIEVK